MKLSCSTPGYLSIDFYSRQPKELRDRNCYVIRTGKGNFLIFEEKRFRKAVRVKGARQRVPDFFEVLGVGEGGRRKNGRAARR